MGYSRPRFITMCTISASGASPNDATLYYVGATSLGLTTVTSGGGMIVPATGHIRMAQLLTYAGTAAGTAEDWTISIRNNTTTTDYTFATVSLNTAIRKFINNQLDIPVTEGDEIFFKTTTPTWVTNPEGVRVHGTIWVEVA